MKKTEKPLPDWKTNMIKLNLLKGGNFPWIDRDKK